MGVFDLVKGLINFKMSWVIIFFNLVWLISRFKSLSCFPTTFRFEKVLVRLFLRCSLFGCSRVDSAIHFRLFYWILCPLSWLNWMSLLFSRVFWNCSHYNNCLCNMCIPDALSCSSICYLCKIIKEEKRYNLWVIFTMCTENCINGFHSLKYLSTNFMH